MIKKIMLIAFLSLFLICSLSANTRTTKNYKSKVISVEKPFYTKIESFQNGEAAPYSTPHVTDDPIGTVYTVGTTWWDLQHPTTCPPQVQVDSEGYVHIVWTNGLDNGAAQRHIYYQLIDPEGVFLFPGGVQVDNANRSGYAGLLLNSDGLALPIFHRIIGSNARYHSCVGNDFIPRIGAFLAVDLPWVYDTGVDLEVIWPKAAIDINDRIHVISHENPPGGTNAAYQRNYYGWAHYNPSSMSMEICEEQELVCWTNVIASTVAASPVSDRVAVGWLEMAATGIDSNQYDNDLIVCISEDGLTWDWNDTINITNWIPPNLTLPDTSRMNRDTLRVFPDICLFFDYNDVLHTIFSTRGYYSLEGTLTWGNGFIWHWSEEWPFFSMVANGWFENGNADPGSWNVYANRSNVAVDPNTGDIYCMFQRYINPVAPSTTYPYPYLEGDTTDFSAGGFPNGDIWVTKSIDNGSMHWSEGVNVTMTQSPGALPGFCLSELTPSMAPQVYNDSLYIFYILDKDAGAITLQEGTWTLNDAICQTVSVNDIPGSPFIQNYPMHCDSTGFFEFGHVEPGENSTPLEFILHPPYPNPFNASTAISYQLLAVSYVNLTIYDIAGREVAKLVDGMKTAGSHQVVFDAKDLTSGVYFARLTAGEFRQTRKILLIK